MNKSLYISPYKGENNKQEGVGINSPSQARDFATSIALRLKEN
jgi:hypothetical protein